MAGYIVGRKNTARRITSYNVCYTKLLRSKDDAVALAKGKTVFKMGPWLYGLYSGAIAFKSVADAKDFLTQKGYEPQRWRIFKLSGDYKLDVTDGVINKTLALSKEIDVSSSPK